MKHPTGSNLRRPRRELLAWTGFAAVGLLAAAVIPSAPGEPPPQYHRVAGPPVVLPAGTVIAGTVPRGWSHLVLMSRPAVRADQRNRVNDLTAQMAGWMFTAFVADVERDGTTHRLGRVGFGLGTSIDGVETIVRPDSPGVGWIGRAILSAGYERLKHCTIVVRGPAFAVVDTPVCYRTTAGHEFVRFRYALVVDPKSGGLETVVWRIDPDGKLADPPAAVRLARNPVDSVELVIAPARITLGVPDEMAFAVDRLPATGSPVSLPVEARELAARPTFTPAEAAALEAGVRKLLVPTR
ncbi:MAG: hypothetical protein ACRC7O_07195 [Fimbriiglobus sp.]